MLTDSRSRKDHAALCAERLGAHGRDDEIARTGQSDFGDQSPAAWSAYSECMRFVDEQRRRVFAGNAVELLDGCRFAVDRVDRIGDDQCPLFCATTECRCDGRDIAAADDDHSRARQSAPVDERRVGSGVGHDEVAAADECGDGSDIGEVAGRKAQCRIETHEVGDVVLEVDVQPCSARDESRRRRPRSELVERRMRAREHCGVCRESEIVVGRQVEHRRSGVADEWDTVQPSRIACRSGIGEPVEGGRVVDRRAARGLRHVEAAQPGTQRVVLRCHRAPPAPTNCAHDAVVAAAIPEQIVSTSESVQTNGGIV